MHDGAGAVRDAAACAGNARMYAEDVTARDLPRLRAFERAKRLVLLGLVVTVYGAGWLLVAWRASRVGETECRIERIPESPHCKWVHGAEDGLEHATCCDTEPSLWAHTPVGGVRRCYYFRSSPDSIFFEPRHYVWLTPGRIGLLGVGLALVAAGLAVGILGGRSAARPVERDPTGAPYRVPEPPPASPAGAPREPLAIARSSRTGCVRWVLVSPLAAWAALLAVLSLSSAWEAIGAIDLFDVVVSAAVHAAAFLGVLGLGYRSGLVFDATRGIFFSWWGVGRPWFRRYEALAVLRGAEVHVLRTGKRTFHELALVLDGGRTLPFSVDDPDAAAAAITGYLGDAS
jgi:hypothetical protein